MPRRAVLCRAVQVPQDRDLGQACSNVPTSAASRLRLGTLTICDAQRVASLAGRNENNSNYMPPDYCSSIQRPNDNPKCLYWSTVNVAKVLESSVRFTTRARV